MNQHLMIPILFLIFSTSFTLTICDTNKDVQECSQSLTGLATCLPYVQGSSKAPTADCCNGLKQVLKTNKKCLCVVVKDGNDPTLALGINVTLALNLPSVCNAPADVSKCPALLHMDPKSPEAKVFSQFGHASSLTSESPVSSPVASPSPTPGSSSLKSNGEAKSGKRWMSFEVIVGGLLIGIIHFKNIA